MTILYIVHYIIWNIVYREEKFTCISSSEAAVRIYLMQPKL